VVNISLDPVVNFSPEQVVNFDWNQWSEWPGIRKRRTNSFLDAPEPPERNELLLRTGEMLSVFLGITLVLVGVRR